MFGMFGVWLKSNRTNLLEDENRSKLNSAHPHPSCLVLSVLRLPKVFCVERKNWSQWEKMWLIQLPLHGFLGISNLPIKKSVYFARSIFYLIWRPRLEPRSRKTWRQPSSGFVCKKENIKRRWRKLKEQNLPFPDVLLPGSPSAAAIMCSTSQVDALGLACIVCFSYINFFKLSSCKKCHPNCHPLHHHPRIFVIKFHLTLHWLSASSPCTATNLSKKVKMAKK